MSTSNMNHRPMRRLDSIRANEKIAAENRRRKEAGLPPLDPTDLRPEFDPYHPEHPRNAKPKAKPVSRATPEAKAKPAPKTSVTPLPKYDPDADLTFDEWVANFKAREARRVKPLVQHPHYDVDVLFPDAAEVINLPKPTEPPNHYEAWSLEDLLAE